MTELIAIAGGLLVSGITEMLKGIPTFKDNPRLTVVLISIGIGIIYTLFKIILPIEFQQHTIRFIVMSLTSAVTIYEFLKGIKK